jgi:TRAP-type C4-dicarboxylate transport system permease large subunit
MTVPMACLACTLGANWLIYSVAAGESLSVAGLLLAGILPAILLGGAAVALCCVAAWWKGYSLNPRGLSLRIVMQQMPRALPVVFLPVLVLAGLISGMLTATAAGAIAVAHTIWMGFCAMREVRGRSLPGALLYAGLYIVVPFALPLAIVVGLVNYPEVFAWLPRLFGF